MKRTLPLLALVMLIAGCAGISTPNEVRKFPPVGTYTLTPTSAPVCECLSRQYEETMRFGFAGSVGLQHHAYPTANGCEIVSAGVQQVTILVTLVDEQPGGNVNVAVHANPEGLGLPSAFLKKSKDAAAKCGTGEGLVDAPVAARNRGAFARASTLH